MIATAQSDKRDFVLRSGRIQTVSDLDAAITVIENTIRSQKGEYKYNQSKGIDFYGNIFGDSPNYQLFESQVRLSILGLTFVESITSFEYRVVSNNVIYTITVKTTYGTGVISNG